MRTSIERLKFSRERFDELMAVDRTAWRKEVMAHEELFINLHDICRRR